jgi:arylsulfatase A-like enzyme
MNRRHFLKTSACAAGAVALGKQMRGVPALVSPEARRDRPNLFFIFTDQQQADALSCAGALGLRTPAMDSLAARGVRFARAYAFQPLCLPSRTCLMTGQPPRPFGIRVNNREPLLPPGTPTVGRLAANAGYDTAYVGKWHVPIRTDDVALHGFADMRGITNEGRDDLVLAPCDAILRQSRTRPLFLVAALINPHDACEYARGQPLPNGDLPPAPPAALCPPLPPNHALLPDEPAALARVKELTPRVYPTADWGDDQWRRYIWAYHRLVEKSDALVGRLLESLAAAGRERDTLVVFSSDHGDGGGSHLWNQKSVLYEESVRVPFLVAGPGITGRGRVDDEHLVSLGLDFLPTICDYAGATQPEVCPGRSVRPLVEGPRTLNTPWRDHLIAETEFHLQKNDQSSGIMGRMARTERFKYIAYSEGAHREQLFDLGLDSRESRNLAHDPVHAAELHRHRALLAEWAKRTHDDFPLVTGAA